MGLFGGTSRAATLNTCIWRDTQDVVCRFAQITSGTPLVWHLIEYQRQDVSSCFGSPAKKSSLKQFHGAFFCFFFLSRYKIAPGTSSSFSFTFSCFFFQFHLPLCYFGCILLFFFSFFQSIKLPQAHLHSASHFHVFSFNSTFRFATLSCFNPAETFLFSFRHVCLHSRPRK